MGVSLPRAYPTLDRSELEAALAAAAPVLRAAGVEPTRSYCKQTFRAIRRWMRLRKGRPHQPRGQQVHRELRRIKAAAFELHKARISGCLTTRIAIETELGSPMNLYRFIDVMEAANRALRKFNEPPVGRTALSADDDELIRALIEVLTQAGVAPLMWKTKASKLRGPLIESLRTLFRQTPRTLRPPKIDTLCNRARTVIAEWHRNSREAR